ncbi:CHAT domain-containing protein [Candidatus Electrothrix sp.]|uniref:CHAT domain-containing protein n=1 Tax=Candidatus Electrothrix sp. TaxID=2170559 RepID=UPI00405639CF
MDDIRAMMADKAAAAYQRAVAMLMQFQESHQAFDMAERARARSLLDQTGSFEMADAPELMEKEQEVRNEIHQLESQLRDIEQSAQTKRRRLKKLDKEYELTNQETITTPVLAKKKQLLLAEIKKLKAELATEYSASRLSKQLKDAYFNYLSVLTRIKLSKSAKSKLNKQDSPSTSNHVASWSDVQQMLAPDTTLLEYYISPEQTFAFVLTHDTFHAVSIPIIESDIEKRISKLPEARQHGGNIYFQQLYQLLFQPVRQYISTSKLYIVPHGILHYLPFSALHDGKQYLVEQYTMANLPSASLLSIIHKKTQPSEGSKDTMVAFCKSEAEGIGTAEVCPQAKKVAELFEAKIFQEDAATETVFKQQAASADYIHIAAHGEFKLDTPLLSRMYLSADDKNDGFLEASEIFNLHLAKNVQLVTLSGCETNMTGRKESEKIDSNTVSAGDEIVSLNRAFISAGAPSILSTLWQVPDESTEKLMLKFYRYLTQGYSKGAALRCAQEAMLQRVSPAKWAGFVLTGDIGNGKEGGASCPDATVGID